VGGGWEGLREEVGRSRFSLVALQTWGHNAERHNKASTEAEAPHSAAADRARGSPAAATTTTTTTTPPSPHLTGSPVLAASSSFVCPDSI